MNQAITGFIYLLLIDRPTANCISLLLDKCPCCCTRTYALGFTCNLQVLLAVGSVHICRALSDQAGQPVIASTFWPSGHVVLSEGMCVEETAPPATVG